jgi:divalent metal cation (Fe/Co/Zn/Cd) transporter
MYMGPENLVITIDANFDSTETSYEVLSSIDRIEARIKERFPQTKSVFVEAENLRTVTAQHDAFEELDEDIPKEKHVEAEKRFFSGS